MNNINDYREILKELYAPMLLKVKDSGYQGDVCSFCAQWGESYFRLEKDRRFMFVGRSVNGWIHDKLDIDILFGEGEDRIFNREDQMRWVKDREGNKTGYNTRHSAFWRVIRRITKSHLDIKGDDWVSHMVWSNLFKVSPHKSGMNPDLGLRDIQRNDCIQIFKRELEFFNPGHIIMFTGGWEGYYLKSLFGLERNAELPKPVRVIPWSKHETRQYAIDGRNFIVTKHPMGKPEDPHINAISELLS